MNPAKVMIVEDNTTVAEDYRECLTALGYDVGPVVASAEDAIAKAETKRPDIILMDIHLRDEMNGIEAADQIYSRFEIPIVFLSAYSDSALLDRAKRVGSFGYLVKPFEEREVFAMLETALYKSAAEKERRELEWCRQRQQRMKSLQTMAANIAHHQNNSLQVIIGNLSLMMDLYPLTDEMNNILKDVEKAAQRSAKLSKLMLLYVGQERGKDLDFNLSKQVHAAIAHLQNTTPDRISISTHLAEEPHPLAGDPDQVEQLIENILLNAIESINNSDGHIVITTKIITSESFTVSDENLPAGKYGVLEISDDGCGMDQITKDQVFDPFFSTKFIGRGLGLAAAFGITHRHGGAISVESELGKGSTFSAFFPMNVNPKPQ